MKRIGREKMSKILIKMPVKPHRQKILTDEGEEMRLQQWANKKAAKELGGLGADAHGEQFESSRNTLMRDAVENPESHNIKFFNDIVPFDVDDEKDPFIGEGTDEAEADWEARQGMIDHEKEQGIVDETQEELDADKKRFASQTTLEDFSTKAYTSRKIAFDDAWNILKALPEQQIYQREPQLRNTRSRLGGDRSATVHPAIEGMLRRKFGEVNLNLAHNTAGQENPLHESPVGVLPEFTRTQKPPIGSLQDDIDFAHINRERENA